MLGSSVSSSSDIIVLLTQLKYTKEHERTQVFLPRFVDFSNWFDPGTADEEPYLTLRMIEESNME